MNEKLIYFNIFILNTRYFLWFIYSYSLTYTLGELSSNILNIHLTNTNYNEQQPQTRSISLTSAIADRGFHKLRAIDRASGDCRRTPGLEYRLYDRNMPLPSSVHAFATPHWILSNAAWTLEPLNTCI